MGRIDKPALSRRHREQREGDIVVRFEWNREKAATNLVKHGVSFDEAVTVFYDPLAATFSDPDHSEGERRLIAVGYSSRNRLVVVCHTDRRAGIRLISARRATRGERSRHEAEA
jgi:uncharacterized DUF497 family protein